MISESSAGEGEYDGEEAEEESDSGDGWSCHVVHLSDSNLK